MDDVRPRRPKDKILLYREERGAAGPLNARRGTGGGGLCLDESLVLALVESIGLLTGRQFGVFGFGM